MNMDFYLKWEEFDQNFKLNYRNFRNLKEFSDVTLVSEDGVHVEAHRLILASSSDVLTDMFRKTKLSQPCMFLRGIQSSELSAILDFMYHGEVKVPQMSLDLFLEAAQSLQVKGLAHQSGLLPEPVTFHEEVQTDQSSTNSVPTLRIEDIKKEILGEVGETAPPHSRTKKRVNKPKKESIKRQSVVPSVEEGASVSVPYNFSIVSDNINLDDLLHEMEHPIYSHEEVVTGVVDLDESKFLFDNVNSNTTMYADIEKQVEEMIEQAANSCWKCKKCGRVMKKRQHIKNHAESHLDGYSHPCHICGKSSKTRNALQNHISYFHKHPLSKMPYTKIEQGTTPSPMKMLGYSPSSLKTPVSSPGNDDETKSEANLDPRVLK